MNTVYIDVLFLINFTVDYLALYLTGKTLRLPLHRWRLIVVSLVGALYGHCYGAGITRFCYPARYAYV